MANLLQCARGHQWDNDRPADSALCPVCGESATRSPEEEPTLVTLPPPHQTQPQILDGMARPGADLPRVPGYEILGVLGRGGMGAVYHARQIKADRIVALKLPYAVAGPELRARFRSEAKAVARFQHPHIVQVFDVGETDESPYMALEFCSGGNLADRLDGTPMPPRTAVELIVPIARAIAAAHAAGIVHRDLKPANILLQAAELGTRNAESKSEDGSSAADSAFRVPSSALLPKVADFGLARSLTANDGRTLPGVVIGTPSYMAPEQAGVGGKHVGPPADIHALGAMLYELFTGRPPFKGTTVLETLELLGTQEPVPPSRLQPRLPRDLETVVLRCLQKAPERRYPSADALADDLNRFLAGRPVLARPVGWPERLAKRVRRNPLTSLLLLLLAAAVCTGVGFGVWKQVRLTQERDRSRAHFQLSLRAIDELLTEVAEQDLATEPRAERTRRALLEKAHNFYKEMLAKEAGDPVVAWEAARAARRVGDIDRLLGRYPEAIAAYDEALVRLAWLRAGGPGDDSNWQEAAHAYNWRGECQRLREQLDAADADYREAAGIYSRLGDRLLELALSMNNRGIVAGVRGQFPEADVHFKQAVDLLAGDARPGSRQQAARVALNRSDVLRKAKKPAEAVRAADAAANIFDALIAERPERLEYQQERAAAGINLAIARFAAGDAGGATAAAADSRTRLESLSRMYPNTVLFRVDLARVCTTLAQFAYATDRAAAQEHTRAAIGHWEVLIAKNATVPAYHGELGIALGNLGRMTKDRAVLSRGIDAVLVALKANAEDPDFRQSLRQQTRDLADVLAAAGEERRLLEVAARLNEALPGYGTLRAVCFLARAARTVKAPDALLTKAIHIVRAADPAAVKGLLDDADCDPFRPNPAFRAAFER